MLRTFVVWMFPAIAIAGGVAPRNVEELKAAIQEVLVRSPVPGVGIAIVKTDGVVWAGGVGKADLATGCEVTADTLFRLGSISKSFVALALMKLAEEGRIDLEATLESVAPEIEAPNPWKATHPVRIVHVLEHTAGFDEARFAEDYLAPGAPDQPLLAVLQRFPGPQRVRWPPGTRMAYSNPGYVVAGYLIEKVTGRPYDEYIRNSVLRPLGMERSGFTRTDANRELLAQGYNYRPPKAVPYRTSLVSSAGDLMSSPGEFARFLQMMLRRGVKSLDRMEWGRTSLAAQGGLKSMYGLANYRMPGSYHRQGHGGLIAGFRSLYAYLPEAGVAYVVMSNSSMPNSGWHEIMRLVSEHATAGTPKVQPPPPFTGQVELERFAGVYLPQDYRNQIAAFSEVYPRAQRVTISGGALYMGGLLGEGRRKLVPVTATTFRAENDPEATVAFVQSLDGKNAMAGPRGYFERAPAWQPYAYAAAVAISFLLMASSILYALVWVWRRRTPERAISLAAVLCLGAAGLLVAAGVEDMSVLGYLNARTVGYCVFSWLFAAFAVWGVVLSLRRPVKIHSLLVSAACCVVAAALAHWGLFATRLWLH